MGEERQLVISGVRGDTFLLFLCCETLERWVEEQFQLFRDIVKPLQSLGLGRTVGMTLTCCFPEWLQGTRAGTSVTYLLILLSVSLSIHPPIHLPLHLSTSVHPPIHPPLCSPIYPDISAHLSCFTTFSMFSQD